MNPNLPFFLKVSPFLIISGGLTKKVPSMISTGKPRFSAPASQEITPGKYTMSFFCIDLHFVNHENPHDEAHLSREKEIQNKENDRKFEKKKGEGKEGGVERASHVEGGEIGFHGDQPLRLGGVLWRHRTGKPEETVEVE